MTRRTDIEDIVVPTGQELDAVPEPVFSLITEQTFIGATQPHQHGKAQLLYVMSGVITVEAAGGVWTVPPRCALWLPGGMPHSGRASGHVKLGHLYFAPSLAGHLLDGCGILLVQPLLRELILRLVERPTPQLDELQAAPPPRTAASADADRPASAPHGRCHAP